MKHSLLQIAINYGASKGELTVAKVSDRTIRLALRAIETIVKMVIVYDLTKSILTWLHELATTHQF